MICQKLNGVHTKIAGFVAWPLLWQLMGGSPCMANTYIARYSATYSDVTPKSYFIAEKNYYDFVVSHGNPPWAANIAGILTYHKDHPEKLSIQYNVLVAQNDKDILCVIDSPMGRERDVMLYDHVRDFTYTVNRHKGSIGSVWIDRGLNTWKLPFVPLTGIASPFLKSGQSEGAYAYPFPLRAAPPRSVPGAYTNLLYVGASGQSTPSGFKLTSVDPNSGNKTFEWEFRNSAHNRPASHLVASDIITRTDYQEQPISPFALEQKNYASVRQGLWNARLTSYSDSAVDPAIFQISQWLERSDAITDNRHTVRKIAYYQSSYGDLDQQLYREDKFRITPSVKQSPVPIFGTIIVILGLVLTFRWMLRRRKDSL